MWVATRHRGLNALKKRQTKPVYSLTSDAPDDTNRMIDKPECKIIYKTSYPVLKFANVAFEISIILE